MGPGILDLNGYNQTLAGVFTLDPQVTQSVGRDDVTNSAGTAAMLTINNSSDYDFEGYFSGNLAIDKYGAGTLTVGGNSTNSGDVAVYNGTLDVTGGMLCKIYTVGAPAIPNSSATPIRTIGS